MVIAALCQVVIVTNEAIEVEGLTGGGFHGGRWRRNEISAAMDEFIQESNADKYSEFSQICSHMLDVWVLCGRSWSSA